MNSDRVDLRLRARVPLHFDFVALPQRADESAPGIALTAAIRPYVFGYAGAKNRPFFRRRLDSDRETTPPDKGLCSSLGAECAAELARTALNSVASGNTSSRWDIATSAAQNYSGSWCAHAGHAFYASALGGFNLITTGSRSTVERLELDAGFVDLLHSRLVLAIRTQTDPGSIDNRPAGTADDRLNDKDWAARSELEALTADMKFALLSQDLEQVEAVLNHQNGLTARMCERGPVAQSKDLASLALSLGASAASTDLSSSELLCVCLPAHRATLRSALASHRLNIVEFEFDDLGVHVGRV